MTSNNVEEEDIIYMDEPEMEYELGEHAMLKR